jgi:hypothetical protein
LKRPVTFEDNSLIQRAVEIEKTITGILGKDLLPPYPIYLLLLLQQLESNTALDTAAASYGRLYGAVMTAYLSKSSAGGDLETKINYLSELSYYLYSTHRDHLTDDETQDWHAEYCSKHLELLEFTGFRDDLVHAQVLQYRNGSLRFRYRAGFYYFVSMYLSDNLMKDDIRQEVKRLSGELYREDAANIVMFLCHQSKDALILDEVLASADRLFKEYAEADMVEDGAITFTSGFQLEPPILEDRDPEKNRLQALDRGDAIRKRTDDQTYEYRFEDDNEDDSETRQLAAKLNAAFKTIQIAGQILRNFGGRLEGNDKTRLTEACYSLGLRIMKFVYTEFETTQTALLDAAQNTLCENDPNIDAETARRIASTIIFMLLRLMTFGVIKHISNSVGLERLSPVFATVLKTNPTISRQLIDLSIRLDHFSAIPEDQVLSLNKEFRGSPVALAVLQQLGNRAANRIFKVIRRRGMILSEPC